LVGVDASGRRDRTEAFAADRLGDAVARLYACYAELLPAGSERNRAAATARSVATMSPGPFDPERFAAATTAAIEIVDHRTVGTWSTRGRETALRNLRSLAELSGEVATRFGDVLDLRPNGYLVRQTTFGTVGEGGGAFERPYLGLRLFGADGLVNRIEFFDPD